MPKNNQIPLSLYIHFPWCMKKCPYCDFHSYPVVKKLSETEYINALTRDLKSDLAKINNRKLQSIFIGGGTPSLFNPKQISHFLNGVNSLAIIPPKTEITLEANPETIDLQKLRDLRVAGVNRLSVGIQSFQEEKLAALGRIHTADTATKAIKNAQTAGFENINIDLMYGLPQQTIKDAIYDIRTALALNPSHLSWYQLTIEPNTIFYKKIPNNLPDEKILCDIQEYGQEIIAQHGFGQYEISAYCKPNCQSQHNMNYWLFGDYLGIGAGAHGKITDSQNQITRAVKIKNPRNYINKIKHFSEQETKIDKLQIIAEFMMNALRLNQPIPLKLFVERTGLDLSNIINLLAQAQDYGFLKWDNSSIKTTIKGRNFLNELLEIFI